MRPEGIAPGSPEDWIRYAKADLAMARGPLPKAGLHELLCFHAQQAAEKSIKAVLLHHGISFPKTHILAKLIDLLPPEVERTKELLNGARLSVYSTAARYPADEESVTEEEHREAIRMAEAIVFWAENAIGSAE